MSYRQFVKDNFHSLGDMPAKEKMKKLGEMWRKHTGKAPMAKKMAKGKGVVGGAEGAGVLSGLLGSIGLGMEPKRHRKMKGKGVVGGDAEGSGIFSDVLGSIGLGVQKGGRKMKGKGVAGGDVAGGSMFGDMGSNLSNMFHLAMAAIGHGMPEKDKVKHYKKMVSLEKQLHEKGKLSPTQHHKLKVYHTLHGAGFFDSLWSGVKKGVSTVASVVPAALSVIPAALKVLPTAAKFIPGVGKLAGPLAKVGALAGVV